MSEILAGVAAVASVSQLLAYLIQISSAAAVLLKDVVDAPIELRRIDENARILYTGLKLLESREQGRNDDDLLPPDLRSLIGFSLKGINDLLTEFEKRLTGFGPVGATPFRHKFKYAIHGRHEFQALSARLNEASSTLQFILTALNLHRSTQSTLLLRTVVSQNSDLIQKLSNLEDSIKTADHVPPNAGAKHERTAKKPLRSPLRSLPQDTALSRGMWLRRLGFLMAYSSASTRNNDSLVQMWFGYKLPTWFANKCISASFQLLLSSAPFMEISILSGHIRLQNQIGMLDPFMRACREGDEISIRQYMRERSGIVNSRTSCSGKTPLLLAIESKNLDAIRCLLEAGADPNIGDDDRTLPIFAALGYKDERIARIPNCGFTQLPPATIVWVDIVRALIEYGASAHESIDGETITTLNVLSECLDPHIILDFFRLLVNEQYTDFDIAGDRDKSALWIALRSREAAVSAIDILSAGGVDMSRVLANGRSVLHLAARTALHPAPLQHLYDQYGVTDVNRKDQYGCTPLHYAIDSAFACADDANLDKVRFLLTKGADPQIQGDVRGGGLWPWGPLHHDGYLSPVQQTQALYDVQTADNAEILMGSGAQKFFDFMMQTGLLQSGQSEEDLDVFHDAVEEVRD